MTAKPAITLGIDFGTTNTVVAMAGPDGEVEVMRFAAPDGDLTTFRSTLGFQLHEERGRPPERIVEAGPWAIDAYVEDPLETRFIQSFKTFAASPAFTETVIDNRRYGFEDLLSSFLFRLRHHGGTAMERLPARVIVGRPVSFAGGSDARLALERYQTAFSRLGFTDIRYAYEPVGAAFFFARQLECAATVLVADFGGGTSDFSIVRFEPGPDGLRSTALARSGVGVAGDAFDYRIIDRLVSPELGKGSEYRSFDKILPIPQRYFAAFARWDQLALLRASRDMKDIRDIAKTALEPEKLARLIEVLDDNHGYRLYQAISRLKMDLSDAAAATFEFSAGSIHIQARVARSDFEEWISPELAAIEHAVDEAVERSGLRASEIDRIFLTGGTSFVQAVREIFHRRFDPGRIETGGEFESIASGLALIGHEADLDLWTERQAAGETAEI
ncbi:Hsp70 family protein [Brevundimonas variabilis]|uniref:Putative chaperone protein n=1 Tax=Brevundimonas variabilis TaxID=74312 RepID=A0A7W9CIV1_9CAUL|nr:Hsp70 family protein [Brevundimonas variabilis]MBB5746286.1 putative chaperone protein [Brevundimonas variabilis]